MDGVGVGTNDYEYPILMLTTMNWPMPSVPNTIHHAARETAHMGWSTKDIPIIDDKRGQRLMPAVTCRNTDSESAGCSLVFVATLVSWHRVIVTVVDVTACERVLQQKHTSGTTLQLYKSRHCVPPRRTQILP